MEKTKGKVIITAALTGSLTMPSQTPYLPLTPEQLREEAERCREAGAAVVHLHARNPVDGSPTADPDIWEEIIGGIRERTDLVICATTGGSLTMAVEERAAVIPRCRPEMASLNMGSMNASIHPLAEKVKEWKYPWEKAYVEGTRGAVFKNTFSDMEYLLATMQEHGTKPELEIYDVGHLYNALFMLSGGYLKRPLHMQFVMGVLGGIGTAVEDLVFLKRKADHLFGEDFTWSVIGVGYPASFHLGAVSVILGGHIRVGLEDNIRIARGRLAESNADLVARAVRLVRELDREPASPEEARAILGIKGSGASGGKKGVMQQG
ncbi:MAG: 3-keto-5-aminohexanoate cleavage protein [Actinobacteria bacterium]|nr:3-keto-5-aminohexanoate cleavage protein [Actinomycetota bacterium]